MTDADPTGPEDDARTDPAPESGDEDLVFLDDTTPEEEQGAEERRM